MLRAAADQPLDIVRLMFELRARDLYGQIQVNSEPYSMNLFRQRVHDTWLMNNCATSPLTYRTGASNWSRSGIRRRWPLERKARIVTSSSGGSPVPPRSITARSRSGTSRAGSVRPSDRAADLA